MDRRRLYDQIQYLAGDEMKNLMIVALILFAAPQVFAGQDLPQGVNLSDYAGDLSADQADMLLQKLQDNQGKINEYLETSGLPKPLKAFASGRYTVHVGNETLGIVMEDGKLGEIKEGAIENPTSEVWADEDLIKKVATSDDPVGTILEAKKTGELKNKDYGLIPKIKGFLVSVAMKIFSFFT